MDKVNPLSPINKKLTMMKKAKITKLKDKKKKLQTKVDGIGNRITTLKVKIDK